MGCVERYFKLRREDIVFVKYTFEALDNLVVVSTVNRDRDIIVIRIAPGCEDEVERVLESFEGTVSLEEIEAPDATQNP